MKKTRPNRTDKNIGWALTGINGTMTCIWALEGNLGFSLLHLVVTAALIWIITIAEREDK